MTLSEWFTDESRWIQNTGAKNRDGFQCPYYDPQVSAYCLYAAVIVFCVKDFTNTRTKLVKAIEAAFPDRVGLSTIVRFNDHKDTTFEDIKKVIEMAGL